MACLMGVDVGTSGLKTIVMREDGEILGAASREYPLLTPRPGWSEQDPREWWDAFCETAPHALAESGVDAAEVKGVGLSGQMHGSVFLDAAGEVVRPCILWNDSRTWRECEEIMETVGADRMREWVGNPAMTGFTAPKALWLKKNEPDNFDKVATLLLPKDYVRFRMTGERTTEHSDAAGTVLFDVRRRKWSTEIFQALGIPESWAPPSLDSAEVAGTITAEAARACGLAEGTPVVGGGADNPCGAVGSGVVAEGRVMLSLGTSGVVYCPSGAPRIDERDRLHAFCAAVPEQWYLMGVVLSAGMCLRWFRDKYAPHETRLAEAEGVDPYERLMREYAAKVPIGCEGLRFLPYIMGERTPLADPHARGAWIGLSFRHGPEHLFRALVEGVTFALRDNLEIVRALGVPVDQIRLIGGGAKSPLWRQMTADVLGAEIVTLKGEEGPAQGAALLAGVGVGLFEDLTAACDALIPIAARVEPDAAACTRYDEAYELFKDLYPALKDHFRRTSRLLEES